MNDLFPDEYVIVTETVIKVASSPNRKYYSKINKYISIYFIKIYAQQIFSHDCKDSVCYSTYRLERVGKVK